jgi:AraC-like DNA-binding protein
MDMSAANRALIDCAVDFVLQHYAERLTVRRLADTLGCRRPELDRLFRRRFGLTVPDYVRHVRLEHADEFVSAGMPIGAVAVKVGYRTTAAFRAQFKRYFGSLPVPSARARAARSRGADPGPDPFSDDRNETRRRLARMLSSRPDAHR